MTTVFYVASGLAVVAAFLAVTRTNALHAVLYLVVALFALALDFLALGAPFVAALEVIVYAGAIMVVILFVVMMIDGSSSPGTRERRWLAPRAWIVPSLLAAVLAVVAIAGLSSGDGSVVDPAVIAPREVGSLLFSTYVIGVELASILLLAGLVGAYYLGERD